MHRVDCSWLLALQEEVEQLRARLEPLQGLLAAKYLNPFCAEKGCQWLTAHYEAEDAERRAGSILEQCEDQQNRLVEAGSEIEDFRRSFELYHTASMALMHAYKRAHPEVPEHVWPDATVVNVWAAEQIDKGNGRTSL